MDFNRFNNEDLEALLSHLEKGKIDEVENMFKGRGLVFSRNEHTADAARAELEKRRQRNARAPEETQLRRTLLGGSKKGSKKRSKKRSKKGSKKRRVNKKKSSKKQKK